MVERNIQTEMLLELVLSANSEPDEQLILKKSIPLYLKKLNCFQAGVLKKTGGKIEELIVIPFVASKSENWSKVKAYFAKNHENTNSPCIQYNTDDSYYYAYNLSSYGMLVLGRKKPFDNYLINELEPIVNHLGKFLLQAEDVEKRKKAEKSLRESELRLRAIAETTTAGIFIYHSRKIVYANSAAEQLSGYSHSELLRLNIFDILHPDFIENVKAQGLDQNPKSNQTTHLEVKIIHKSGWDRWMDVTIGQIEWKGFHSGIISAFDITAKKKNEEDLRSSQQIVEGIINAIPVRVFWKDRNLCYLGCNPVFASDAGFASPKELIGKTDYQMGWRSQAEFYRRDDMQVIESGISKFQIEEPQTTPDGRIITLLTSKMPMRNSEGKIVGVLGTYMDITEIKRSKEELLNAKRKAEESDRLKSAFLANMSHEIRTPMNGILGFAELLKKPDLTGEQQKKYVRIIEKSGFRMLNIINDIVDISKIESGLMKTEIRESNINEQIEYIYTFFKPEVEAKGMKLLYRTPLPTNESIIRTDREKVYAILTNLVKNAIKYSVEGTITFGYEKKGEFLEFFIKDSGFGIPSDRLNMIFERFVQADIEDISARQGAGLGLAITKSYVEMLGGTIYVESQEGVGSTFYFTLPYIRPLNLDSQIENPPLKKHLPIWMEMKKILIVEDDEISEKLITIMLSSLCQNIMVARTGPQAIETCKNNPDIDFILMDIKLPEINGYEVCRRIRKFNNEVVIIAQTAFGLSGDREKAIAAGCNDYISKPIVQEKLIEILENYFKK